MTKRQSSIWHIVAYLTILLAIPAISLAHPQVALADGVIIIDPPFPEPPPDFSQWLTIRNHHVTVTIKDQVATTEVDQVFRNDAAVPVEGTYVFPLPPGAVVEDFIMWVDGQPVESEILPADEAREIYEGYVRRHQDPALLEYVGRDTVRARIFPIPPNDERRIKLRYTQLLPVEDDLMFYRYPLDTERFSAKPLEEVTIQINISAGTDLGAIYSPSHQGDVTIDRPDERRAVLTYTAYDVYPDRDFELYVGRRTDDLGAQLLSFNPTDEDGFFLLMLTPPVAAEESRVVPRDIVLVLDTSGSMEGEKLDQAKAGLAYIVRHLNPEDRFNIVAFSSQTRTYAPALVSPQEAEAAIAWIEALEALGGTNIYVALTEALGQAQTTSSRPTTVVFLTDGLPTEGIVEEDAILSTMLDTVPETVRIFPLGVGYDVNVLLLDQLASDHRGRPSYIAPGERIDEKVSSFFMRMQSPLLTNITLALTSGNGQESDVRLYDLYPTPLPDIYAGTQLIVAGRYMSRGPQTLVVSGRIRDREVQYTYPVDFEDHDGAGFIPRLWAARKIGHLLTQIRLHGEQGEWIDAVVDLSLKYGIITPYTSFLIEEPETALSQEARDQAGDMMQEEMTAMPQAASGEEAVEDAKLRQDLGEAEAPVSGGGRGGGPREDEGYSSTSTLNIQYVGDKAFLCTSERCTDTTYIPETMPQKDVTFMSQSYKALLSENPEWASYFALAPETIFVADDGTAYRFTLDDGAEPEANATSPASSASGTATPPPDLDTTPTTPRETAATSEVEGPPPETESPSDTNPGICSAPLVLLITILALALRRK